jgi:hypothetical protein
MHAVHQSAGPPTKATNSNGCQTKANGSAETEADSQGKAKANIQAETQANSQGKAQAPADCKEVSSKGLS